MSEASKRLIREKLQQFDAAGIEPHFSELNKQVGERCDAILAYGSTLSPVTRSSTSTPDFYLIVPSYRHFHSSWVHAILNWFLPPNIYHFEVAGKVSKYNVLSAKDLVRETGICTPDCYNLGRMSKRIAIAFSKGPAVLELVVDAQFEAMRTIASKVFHLMPTAFTLEEFSRMCIGFSYMADVRVEAGDKVARLFEADREYYQSIYGDILSQLFLQTGQVSRSSDGEVFHKQTGRLKNMVGKFLAQYFLAKSQIRAQMRWPKGIFTVKGWVDYLLAKVERTQGIRLEVTEHEKRFWYIYGWKYFFRLRRKNLIK